ncbi:hypothetical protein BH11BAC5_BH11BAC5_48310 [soil metagenome]
MRISSLIYTSAVTILTVELQKPKLPCTTVHQSYTAATASPELFGRLYSLLYQSEWLQPGGLDFFLLSFFVSKTKKVKRKQRLNTALRLKYSISANKKI